MMTKVLDEQLAVVIPLYNKERSIERAIDSVLKQTVNFKRLIIVNDGSTDNSLAVAKQFNDERIVIIDQANQGVCAARNNGAKVANADYVCFLDADDAWEPHFLEEITQLITMNPQASLFCARYGETSEDGHFFIGQLVGIEDGFKGSLPDFFMAYRHNRSLYHPSASCVNISAFNQIGGFPLSVKIGEDIYLALQLALVGEVMFSTKVSSTVFRDAENRTNVRERLTEPYHLTYFFDAVQAEMLDKNPSLKSFLLYNATIAGLHATEVGNRRLARNLACKLFKQQKRYGIIVFIGTCLPKCAIRLLKKWRNKKTLSYE